MYILEYEYDNVRWDLEIHSKNMIFECDIGGSCLLCQLIYISLIYIYGVTVPQPTAERVSQPAVTWLNICHISVAECRRQKNQKNPA